MFDFLKNSTVESNNKQEDESEYEWLVESFVQFLVSPIWKLNINSYVDENCIFFEDVEENQLEHLNIHKEFIKIAENLLDDFIQEMCITMDQAVKTVLIGINVPDYKEYFDQLFLLSNFLVFKKQMVRRNKELEAEALEALQKNSGSGWISDEADAKRMEIEALEQEKADLDYCIEMSKMQSNEMKKLEDEDEKLLMEAIRLSEEAFKAEQDKYDADLEQAKKMSKLESDLQAQQQQAKAQENNTKKNEEVVHPMLLKLEEEKRIMTKLTEEMSQPNTTLPPV